MGTLTRTLMNAEVGAITSYNDSGNTAYINTRLQWAMDEIASMFDWEALHTENTTLSLSKGVKTYTIPTTIRKIQSVRYYDVTNQKGSYLQAMGDQEFQDAFPYNDAEITLTDTTGATAGFVAGETVTQATSLATGVVISETGTAPLVLKVSHRTGTFVTGYAVTKSGETYTMTPNTVTADGDYPTAWTRIAGSLIVNPVPGDTQDGLGLYITGYKYPTAFSGDSSTSDLDSRLDKAIIYLAASMVFEMKREETQGASAVYWRSMALDVVNKVWAS